MESYTDTESSASHQRRRLPADWHFAPRSPAAERRRLRRAIEGERRHAEHLERDVQLALDLGVQR